MDNPSNLACTPPALTRGSAVEIVYRRSVELITSPPTPELPESGAGVSCVRDLVRLLVQLMPLLRDRNETRVRHYLVLLQMHGFLDIDEQTELVRLAQGVTQ